ncbi:MAG: 4-aminobutyrate--2-oxoglutarate transaminase [Bacillota bacterium]|nr:4-aminobutyrate--2-oxoglutarate transaminase [Bacillota bacterium]
MNDPIDRFAPVMRTEVPGPEARRLLELRHRYVPRGVSMTVPSVAARASGAVIEDVDGNRYIDFASGIGVLNVGSSHPDVTAAVCEQVQRLLHTCFNVIMTVPYIELAERLASITPGTFPKKALMVNSGAEAVENAVKIARKFTGRPAVVTLDNAFHGRTLLTMTLTGKADPYKLGFGPFAPEVYRAPSPYCYRCPTGGGLPDCGLACLAAVSKVVTVDIGSDQVAAVIAEPVQGEGGFIPLPEGFLSGLRDLCTRHGILLIADEIQTGFGRTGRMFACEHWGVVPDLILLAKSLAAGLPLSAVVGRADVMDSVHVGGLGGTYSGNPVACAAALAVLDVMARDGLAERGARIGEIISTRLRRQQDRLPGIGDVRGLGAMVAVELVTNRATREPARAQTTGVIRYCYEHGLIVLKAGIHDNCVRALPPLVATDDQIEQGMDIWEQALRHVLS